MLPRPARLWALLLALTFQIAAAQSLYQLLRREGGDASPAPTASSPPEVNNADARGGDGRNPPLTTSSAAAAAASSSASDTPSATDEQSELSLSATTTTTAASTATNGPIVDPKFFNATIPAGQLPLTPEITPGWGVSGVIYTLVGIKNRWIHTFSTSYITSLGVAVLIVYVMNIPVNSAVQGGYVVAVVMSGCAVGAASMFFKELTEGLGCALGGFCVSMWLLCLLPGGLLRPVPSKAIFIASFTLVGFAFYFSRWTRDWALIISIAFSGATVTMLDIDCFSRAGLKEFWAYVWDVNGNLFPLGADTYPVTKGIRVETAAIIIFLMGIISQIKLWRIVREKREKRAAERAEGQRNLEQEEENVGRQVEVANARERRQWERVYGHGVDGSRTDSRLSDLQESGSEKKLRDSRNGSFKRRSSVEVIEMADISESKQLPCGHNPLMTAQDAQDGMVTVRVGADVPDTPTDVGDELDEKVGSPGEKHAAADPGKRLSQMTATSRRVSQAQTVTKAPEVVPLLFNVPTNHEDETSNDDRSSIATFAADDAEAAAPGPQQRRSLAKRLSRGSLTLLKGLPQKSSRGSQNTPHESNGSSEELIASRSPRPDDDNESMAATVDGESASGDGRSVRSGDGSKNIDIDAKLAGEEDQPPRAPTGPDQASSLPPHENVSSEAGKARTASPLAATEPSERHGRGAEREVNAAAAPPEKPRSSSSISSAPISLTQERLPRSLSRVAMSYRTNEWAKHLSYAESPEPDELHIYEPVRHVKSDAEKSVPVNMAELRQTAEDGTPAPAIMRSESRASNLSYVPSVSRRASKIDGAQGIASPEKDSPPRNQASSTTVPGPAGHVRSPSSVQRRSSMGFKERSMAGTAAAAVAQPIPEERVESRRASISPSLAGSETQQRAAVPGVVSYASLQTLIGQREMFLRNRSQGSLLAGATEPTYLPASDAVSVHSNSMYPAPASNADPDDIPLSQRKHIMRQSSLMSLPGSDPSYTRLPGLEGSDNLPFNSHQPKRVSTLPTQAMREAQLANFRQSVQHDLRSGTPIMSASGRETPFTPATLLGNREAEVQRNIEMQRNVLMGQKEAEAQRKEMQRREKEFVDKAFDERMRTGDLLEAHREAMRKMQKGARDR